MTGWEPVSVSIMLDAEFDEEDECLTSGQEWRIALAVRAEEDDFLTR